MMGLGAHGDPRPLPPAKLPLLPMGRDGMGWGVGWDGDEMRRPFGQDECGQDDDGLGVPSAEYAGDPISSAERSMMEAHSEVAAGALVAARRNAGSFSFGEEDGAMPSRSGRGAVAGQRRPFSAGGNPTEGGMRHPDPSSRRGCGAVVGQVSAYSTGRNPITGGDGGWGEPSNRVTPLSHGGRGNVFLSGGEDERRPGTAQSARSYSSDVSHQQAHDDAMAGAFASRARNQGSFAFG